VAKWIQLGNTVASLNIIMWQNKMLVNIDGFQIFSEGCQKFNGRGEQAATGV
jgi:hypothetical protein